DHRPIFRYQNRAPDLPLEARGGGRRVAFQQLATEHESADDPAGRKRVGGPIPLPAAGWNLGTVAWVEGAAAPRHPSAATGRGSAIRNEFYQVSAQPGASGIQMRHRGRALF